jgi:hypothetical protein
LREKVRRVTVQPLFAWFKKRKRPTMQKSHRINCQKLLKTETPHPPRGPPTSQECRKWKRWSHCLQRLDTTPVIFTLPLPSILLFLPFLPSATSIFNRPARNRFRNVNGEE